MGKPDSPSLQHATADIEPGVSIHYVVAGSGPRTVVLLHGFPQTWRAWRHIIPRLANAGFRVIAPDYRGAGNSSKPLSGYDKRTMATDIYRLLYEHLKLSCPVAMVGHDIGLMSGREREYLQWFFNFRISNPAAITEADFRDYLTAYTAPGAMRAAFELYRSFDQDPKDNRDLLANKGKPRIPVLVAVGATSPTASPVRGMMEEVSTDPRVLPLPGAGHWIAEENPEGFAAGLIDFMGPHR
ncbi:hypothetical protein XH94_33570 [Bradyrhizobium zhanjiangense]|uniref:AB hydrolase-1 domain-containing protein n=1 Tax=Bradyrhizobium zhanjiangense TaxID=1325107 RepID=A0A4Q0S8R5_9BRAD|nr:hypothetical protein XH94_33570 [Bradyrhizobium zhanjiangense]